MNMATDERMISAQQYIAEHFIDDLFSHLVTTIIYNQPEDPKNFILEELQRMKSDKSASRTDFFDVKDLTTMFSMFDVTGRGYITTEQFKQALANLGHANADVSHLKKGGRLSIEEFIKEASPHITLNLH